MFVVWSKCWKESTSTTEEAVGETGPGGEQTSLGAFHALGARVLGQTVFGGTFISTVIGFLFLFLNIQTPRLEPSFPAQSPEVSGTCLVVAEREKGNGNRHTLLRLHIDSNITSCNPNIQFTPSSSGRALLCDDLIASPVRKRPRRVIKPRLHKRHIRVRNIVSHVMCGPRCYCRACAFGTLLRKSGARIVWLY